MSETLLTQAKEVLRRNDRGTYTVPTHGLYPFQWNWDSALSALGFQHFDEIRAWTEVETLFEHQWEDGMVPHIIFHEHDDGYFPGPDVWATRRRVPTSGITQPPVAGFAVKRMFDRARDKNRAHVKARKLLPKIHAWHEWFFRCRDPHKTGLVAVIHPWETGRDNSVDWDAAFERVPTDGVEPYIRRDTQHANPEHRPTQHQYDRYIWLVQRFRVLEWDNSKLHDSSPFRIVDPGFNAILLRSCSDLADLADALGETEIANQSRAFAKSGVSAMESLWSNNHGQYLCYDRVTKALVDSPSVGGILAAFAPLPAKRISDLARRIETLAQSAKFMFPSHDPTAIDFDPNRYWRGPVWLIVNYMIADGLSNGNAEKVAARIRADSLRLIRESGFAEYYNPLDATPCGGGDFTWTAAMVIEILSGREPVPA